MAQSDARLLRMIQDVVGALSPGECKTLSYLCGSRDPDGSMAGVREMLKTRVVQDGMSPSCLPQLVFWLKRFDILRTVFGTNREEMARTLGHNCLLTEYRVLMVDVSEDLTTEDLNSLKFLFYRILPRERLDKATNFLDVLVELEKLDMVSPEHVEKVEDCLRIIERVDLARKVHGYRSSVGYPAQRSFVASQANPKQRTIAAIPQIPLPSRHSSPLLCQPGPATSPCPARRNVAAQGTSQNCQQALMEEYQLQTNPRGLCVIVDCVGWDGDLLQRTFSNLHFTVSYHQWLGVADMSMLLQTVSRQTRHQNVGAFICCIISRGTDTDLLATDPHGPGLRLDTVRRLFTADACPTLAGRPKIFFIQRYHVPGLPDVTGGLHMDEDLEVDGPSSVEVIPAEADILWSHCWTNLDQVNHSSVYLKTLCNALRTDRHRRSHMLDIHTEMNGAIFNHNRSNPEARYHLDLKHTLRKHLYLT